MHNGFVNHNDFYTQKDKAYYGTTTNTEHNYYVNMAMRGKILTHTHTYVQWMIYSTKFTYRDLFPQSTRQLLHGNTSPTAAATVQYLPSYLFLN